MTREEFEQKLRNFRLKAVLEGAASQHDQSVERAYTVEVDAMQRELLAAFDERAVPDGLNAVYDMPQLLDKNSGETSDSLRLSIKQGTSEEWIQFFRSNLRIKQEQNL